jgi:hypothetical protein
MPRKSRPEKKRCNLCLRPQDSDSLDWLLSNTTHPTMTEVIGTAIRLYHTILENKYKIVKPDENQSVVIITSGGFLS